MSGTDQNKAGAEPSMDDILASIRKILNEDDVPTVTPGAMAPVSPTLAPPAAPEPLMLTDEMLVTEPPQPEPPAAPPPAEPQLAEPQPAAPPPVAALAMAALPAALPPSVQLVPPPVPPALPQESRALPPPPPLLPSDQIIAPSVAAATAASMSELLRAVTQERSASVSRGGPTIEDVVREEVRPLLKEWLDNHLPGIVERAVRAEIERVARGSR